VPRPSTRKADRHAFELRVPENRKDRMADPRADRRCEVRICPDGRRIAGLWSEPVDRLRPYPRL
jgi:hypothetical protein